MMREDVRLYTGICETSWNKTLVRPGAYACISPVYGKTEKTKRANAVKIPKETLVIQDSGAFSDNWTTRLDANKALSRQQKHADKYQYADQITHRATYDLLIDEKWQDGKRTKQRWNVNDAEIAVDITVDAAKFLNQNRGGKSLIVSAQGVNDEQYLRCAQRILSYYQDGDMIGLGGWCIIGKMKAIMMPVFIPTVDLVIPFLAREGVDRVHIWGVIYPDALGYLQRACTNHSIKLSTDSVGVQIYPLLGNWGYGDWRDKNYRRVSADKIGDERARHASTTREWLAMFDDTQYVTTDYHNQGWGRAMQYQQLSLF